MTRPIKMNNFNLWRSSICFCSAISVISLLNSLYVPSWANHHLPDPSVDKNAPAPGTSGQAYTPGKDSKPSKEDHTISGGRQCGNQFVALAPREKIGVTISRHPTFMWSVEGESPNKQDFYLYTYNSQGEKEEVFHDKTLPNSQTGINLYTLPQDEPELEVGKTYIWQVVQHCKKNIFDGATSASLQRIGPANILSKLPNTPLQKAQVYARSGLWYDALTSVHNATSDQGKAFQRKLILDLVGQEPDLEAAPEKVLGFEIKP